MGMLARLARLLERRSEQWGSLSPGLAQALGVGPTSSGAMVTASAAENLATVLACVQAIAGGLASLPAIVYLVTADGREESPDHWLARMVRDGVNDRESWPDFLELLVANALLRGNGLAETVTDNRGAVRELRSVPWDWVAPRVLPSRRLAFDVTEVYQYFAEAGRPRRLLQSEVIHLKDRSDDGLLGRSRLSRAREVVGTGLAVQNFTGAMWKNGAHPSGVLEVDGKLNDPSLARLKEQFKAAFSGTSNAAKAMILDQGVKWKGVSISPEDAELLASRRFTTEELARLYNVPPPIVGIWDHSSFTNSETAGRWFATYCLGTWARKIQAEFRRSVLGRGYELVIDLSDLTRGDYAARWAAHKIAVDAKILTPNEVRGVEGWNKRAGGDDFPPAAAPQPAPTGA